MEKKQYHHGNLRDAMIDVGITIINEEGIKNLSLRKVAKYCDVSHAAPYKHFENKEMLLNAIKAHITDDFSRYLEIPSPENSSDESLLLMFGINYVGYFIEHPAYYKFLFNQPNFHLTITDTNIVCDDFAPFSVFITTVENIMKEHQIPENDISLNILVLLSVVDGLTSILTSDNVNYQGDHKTLVTKILKEKIRF